MQVISADETEEGGNISDETIDAQMKILNSAFEEVGYKFTLVETTRTINAHWYRDVKYYSPVETEIATTLHKGGNATLNVYTVGANNSTDYAWATTASEVQYRPEMDGVFINGTVLVGGSNPEKSEGKTLVHEVGHWFGLYHPFSYQCEFSFDYVDDTPHEMLDYSDPTSCEPRDSCPDHPGVDLIYNHMGYAKDSCRTSWTPGQIQRMREQVAKFRGVVYPGIDVNNIPEDSI
ncbi:hypothetical protein C7974DRAFT_402486 [Boeremia exigua]|uniref:uncharacterized protein n=1 Tax=Boeremia exigua TaxID=749465 RepID=UPI001E8D0A71|nr:uncharacterized protein C7974DRAFT_402486 [Boeremia exigua]KAH6616814.1 hypothetical protein C7974DRAFT_402486 [Boeremia exigua]